MRDARRYCVRTTLAIDDDVLEAAKTLAQQQNCSLGEAISALARRGLMPAVAAPATRNGISLLPRGDKSVTSEIVRQLRDELP